MYYDRAPVSIVLWFKREQCLGTSLDIVPQTALSLPEASFVVQHRAVFLRSKPNVEVHRMLVCLSLLVRCKGRLSFPANLASHKLSEHWVFFLHRLTSWVIRARWFPFYFHHAKHSFEELPFAGRQAWYRMPGACAERLWDARLFWNVVLVACWEFHRD